MLRSNIATGTGNVCDAEIDQPTSSVRLNTIKMQGKWKFAYYTTMLLFCVNELTQLEQSIMHLPKLVNVFIAMSPSKDAVSSGKCKTYSDLLV